MATRSKEIKQAYLVDRLHTGVELRISLYSSGWETDANGVRIERLLGVLSISDDIDLLRACFTDRYAPNIFIVRVDTLDTSSSPKVIDSEEKWVTFRWASDLRMGTSLRRSSLTANDEFYLYPMRGLDVVKTIAMSNKINKARKDKKDS